MFEKNMPLIKEEHFPIEDMKEFYLEATYENISIRLIEGDEITVRQYGEPFLDKEFTSSFKNGILHLYFQSRSMRLIDFSLIGKNLKIEIEMPQIYSNAVTLILSSGSLKVNGHPSWSNTTIENRSGSINMDKIDSDNLSLQSSSGSINIDTASIKNVAKIKTSSGSINISNFKASMSNIESGSGSIRFRNLDVENELMLSASSGSIRCERINSESFNVHSTSGSVNASYLTGKGSIFTSSGSIKINNFKVLGNTQLNASSGSIHLSMWDSQNYNLDIKTFSGSISCNMPLNYSGNRKNIASGTVGDGSVGTLSVSTSSGSIHIG
ncbi:MAG: DUF4097 domain-containing protein [Oscillospiraceae bacterium]|nr:DUF4097 domain-containing protein [Oscillospiraceae bacterium]